MGTPSPGAPARPPVARRGTHRGLFVAVALGWLVADQLTKSWAVSRLSHGRDLDVVWTLRFHLTYNSGASFSVGDGYGRWIALVALGIVGLLVWQARDTTSRLTAVALGMIVGGALGNVVDRAVRHGDGGVLGGSVVDFIDFRWWPVFNVADMGVVMGAVLLVVASLLPEPDEPDQTDEADEADEADADAGGAAPGA